jgi:hypothetical protein
VENDGDQPGRRKRINYTGIHVGGGVYEARREPQEYDEEDDDQEEQQEEMQETNPERLEEIRTEILIRLIEMGIQVPEGTEREFVLEALKLLQLLVAVNEWEEE